MMSKTMESVKQLVDAELRMANEQHPLFASNHEAAAVLLEELEEADEDMSEMLKLYYRMWSQVKHDGELLTFPKEIEKAAMLCACECIQVAAMCEKVRMNKEHWTVGLKYKKE